MKISAEEQMVINMRNKRDRYAIDSHMWKQCHMALQTCIKQWRYWHKPRIV